MEKIILGGCVVCGEKLSIKRDGNYIEQIYCNRCKLLYSRESLPQKIYFYNSNDWKEREIRLNICNTCTYFKIDGFRCLKYCKSVNLDGFCIHYTENIKMLNKMGEGEDLLVDVTCPDCSGNGWYEEWSDYKNDHDHIWCEKCNKTGKIKAMGVK